MFLAKETECSKFQRCLNKCRGPVAQREGKLTIVSASPSIFHSSTRGYERPRRPSGSAISMNEKRNFRFARGARSRQISRDSCSPGRLIFQKAITLGSADKIKGNRSDTSESPRLALAIS